MRSLALKFALASLLPILALGWILSTTTRDSITTRTADVYGSTTASIVRLAAAALLKPEDFEPGARLEPERILLIKEFLARLGVRNSTSRVVVVTRDGTVVYSNYGELPGSKLPLTSSVRGALRGERVTKLLPASETISWKDWPGSPVETAIPVQFEGSDTIHGAVVSSGLDPEFSSGVNRDIIELRTVLAAGLAALWLVLLPIVASVSRRLRRQAQDNEFLAMHDTLTGLPNRNLLNDRLTNATVRADRHGGLVALLLIDLDRFKEVNDTLGHRKGDQLLEHVAERLRQSVRKADTVARLGGDEFAIVLDELRDWHEIHEVVERVTAELAEPLAIDGIDISIEASIGVAIYPTHAASAESLLQHADIAMYSSKACDTAFSFYQPDADAHSPSRLELAGELRRALTQDDGQIVLHFQPVASPGDSRVVALEALIRWNHPTRGMVAPDEFIPLAEQSGLIRILTRFVLNAAVAQATAWRDAGIDVRVAVNLSARDLRDVTIVEDVREVLRSHGLDADRLELEVTETAILASPETAFVLAAELRKLGVSLALDDFGTGYSSLTYLKRLRPDRIKIDRSFVDAITHNAADAAIVRSTIHLAHELQIGVTAEGVENEAQWDLLRELDCDLVQGYHLARPMPQDAVTAWLHQRNPAFQPR